MRFGCVVVGGAGDKEVQRKESAEDEHDDGSDHEIAFASVTAVDFLKGWRRFFTVQALESFFVFREREPFDARVFYSGGVLGFHGVHDGWASSSAVVSAACFAFLSFLAFFLDFLSSFSWAASASWAAFSSASFASWAALSAAAFSSAALASCAALSAAAFSSAAFASCAAFSAAAAAAAAATAAASASAALASASVLMTVSSPMFWPRCIPSGAEACSEASSPLLRQCASARRIATAA